jgi:hypothetical protein
LIWLPETKSDAETTSNLTNIDEAKGLGGVNYDTVLTWQRGDRFVHVFGIVADLDS